MANLLKLNGKLGRNNARSKRNKNVTSDKRNEPRKSMDMTDEELDAILKKVEWAGWDQEHCLKLIKKLVKQIKRQNAAACGCGIGSLGEQIICEEHLKDSIQSAR